MMVLPPKKEDSIGLLEQEIVRITERKDLIIETEQYF